MINSKCKMQKAKSEMRNPPYYWLRGMLCLLLLPHASCLMPRAVAQVNLLVAPGGTLTIKTNVVISGSVTLGSTNVIGALAGKVPNTLLGVTNALALTGSTATFLRSDGTQATPSGSAPAGTVINTVAVSGLLSVDSTKTNGIAATLAHMTNALALTGSTTTFLRSDGTQATPAGGGAPDDTAFAASWNGVTTIAPSKNVVYDWGHLFDTDDDGKVNVLDMAAGIVKTDSGGVVSIATAGTDYGMAADVQIFTTPGGNTWTKPANRHITTVIMFGGGGGGGSGRRGAAASVKRGGGGGASGAYSIQTIPTSLLGATETATVGAGGAGGTAISADNTSGIDGTAGTSSTFGIWLKASGGVNGNGGTASTGAGGAVATTGFTTINLAGSGSGASGAAGIAGLNSLTISGGSGAGGGGITVGDAESAGAVGGNGANARGTVPAGGTAGAIATSGGPGGGVTANEPFGGGGGGSGGSRLAAGAAGDGGAGGIYGGGGGGGGGAVNATSTSGAGGAGANGLIIVITE